MPIYMDLHIVPGVNAKNVADAHSRDVYLEKDHNCTCLTYWIDEMRGHVFCLIDAPNKEAVYELHNRSHGLLPHKIIEVQNDFVESFLGRITDPDSGQYTDGGLLMLNDTSYRIIMFVNTTDVVLLHHTLGLPAALKKVESQNTIIRNTIKKFGGKEALHEGNAIIGSFIAAEKAVECALELNRQLGLESDSNFSIRIHAGEPVAQTDALFGETLHLLHALSMLKKRVPIVFTSAVKELVAKDMLSKSADQIQALTTPDEEFLKSLSTLVENNYSDDDFDVDNYSEALAISRSQLYRKVTATTGFSLIEFLREYRLEKATALLRTKKFNVYEASMETGFTSASYFTKCFKAKFGLLPLAYRQLV